MDYKVKEIITPQNYTNYVIEEVKKAPAAYEKYKETYPDAVLLFRIGDFYETYCEDAQTCHELLGITITGNVFNGYRMAGFPYHALDTYLPKLIRAGKRVCICDKF